jgi:acetyl esterase/lipase
MLLDCTVAADRNILVLQHVRSFKTVCWEEALMPVLPELVPVLEAMAAGRERARAQLGPLSVAERRAMTNAMSQPSVEALADYPPTREGRAEGVELYCDPARHHEPYASPLLAPDLSGLPPALVMTAQLPSARRWQEQLEAFLRARLHPGRS